MRINSRFVTLLALAATAGALNFLTGCTTTPQVGGGSNYNVTAYKPHNPDAVRVKVSLSKQVVYVLRAASR